MEVLFEKSLASPFKQDAAPLQAAGEEVNYDAIQDQHYQVGDPRGRVLGGSR